MVAVDSEPDVSLKLPSVSNTTKYAKCIDDGNLYDQKSFMVNLIRFGLEKYVSTASRASLITSKNKAVRNP